MTSIMPIWKYRVVVLLLAFTLMPIKPVLGVEDTTPPELASIRFSPESISTISAPAEVTIAIVATDDISGVEYFEADFRDPSGVFSRSVSAKFNPSLSRTATAKVIFPRFSNSGPWTLSQVFVSDAAGNTLILTTDQLIRRGMPTTVQVESVQDTVNPKLNTLNFAREIDTSSGSATVNVRYSAADDLSGLNYLEMSFLSPSGIYRRGGTLKLDQGPLTTSGVIPITFPWMSEAGRWTLNSVLLADAAGNTLVLDGDGVARLGLPTELDVKSASDSVNPVLISVHFAEAAIDTNLGSVAVEVDFSATDDFSGVSSFEVVLASPSGSTKHGGSAAFPPQKAVKKSITIKLPQSSEPGAWIMETAILADAAGNTLVLDSETLSAAAGTLRVR